MSVRRNVFLGSGAIGALAAALARPAVAAAVYQPASLDHPRRVVVSLSERQSARVNEVLDNVDNIQKYYGMDLVDIALIAYGPGVRAVIKGESTVAYRIAGLIADGIVVQACNNTLETIHKSAADLLPGVTAVPSGLPAIIEYEARGWFYVRP